MMMSIMILFSVMENRPFVTICTGSEDQDGAYCLGCPGECPVEVLPCPLSLNQEGPDEGEHTSRGGGLGCGHPAKQNSTHDDHHAQDGRYGDPQYMQETLHGKRLVNRIVALP